MVRKIIKKNYSKHFEKYTNYKMSADEEMENK